ncbi:MAG: hypothetical protein JWQ38_1418 [Flavipsychrobacter sp.]|nr:hypothetical protein [Flavipsychrobacter sp.]
MENTIIETAAELYREMKNRGMEIGKRDDRRDDGLIKDLRHRLNCPDDKLASFLKEKNISAKQFLIEFLNIAKPFSLMFEEIWRFLSKHYAPKAAETVSIRFGFSDTHDSVSIDLEEFRRQANSLKLINSITQRTIWSEEALSKLFKLAEILVGDSKQERNTGYIPGEDLQLPTIQPMSNAIDGIVGDVRNLFQKIIDAYYIEVEENNDSTPNTKSKHLAMRLTDFIPNWHLVFSTISRISEDNKNDAYAYYMREIEPLLSFENTLTQKEIKEALDILDLPFWKHRWHTYEIWCTVAILSALEEFNPVPLVVDGQIPLDGYSAEIIAYFEASSFPKSCVTIQVQTPVENGDRKGMKPDLRICFSDEISDINNTAAVVEFKQRGSITKAHIEEVLTSYVVGTPRSGGTIIINYDKTDVVPAQISNGYYFEGVHPGNPNEVSLLKITLQKILESVEFKRNKNNVVLFDISSSMERLYDKQIVRNSLKLFFHAKGFQIYFFNDELVEMDISLNYENIETSGSTNLEMALNQLLNKVGNINRLLIISDGDYSIPKKILDSIPAVEECYPEHMAEYLRWVAE